MNYEEELLSIVEKQSSIEHNPRAKELLLKLQVLQKGRAVRSFVDLLVARKFSLLSLRKIQEIVGTRPAVVTGDFNVTEDDEAYTTMITNDFRMNDAYHMTPHHTGTTYTFHNFCHIPPLKCEKIDFIFITPTIRVSHSHIEVPNPDAMLSDHNPHWADLEF